MTYAFSSQQDCSTTRAAPEKRVENMKIVKLLLATVILGFAAAANAQYLNRSVTASVYSGRSGNATSSSLSLFATNVISGTMGNFSSVVPIGSLLTPHIGTVSGLSTTPLSDSINNYFVFSSQAPFGASGTTPLNRFDFDLSTITEDSYSGGIGDFSGTGTIVDTTSAYQTTAADFTVDFSSSIAYTITLETVPEPGTISLGTTGLLVVIMRRNIRQFFGSF